MKHIAKTLAAVALAAFATTSQAGGIVYFGAGEPDDTPGLSGSNQPFALGFMAVHPTQPRVFGFDIAGEGVMLDSTWGGNELKRATSLNFLAGSNISRGGSTRVDLAAIVGMRSTFADCPDSYIGYQCYADTPPEVEVGLNYGALLTVTFSSLTVGVRATGESTQFVAGFKF